MLRKLYYTALSLLPPKPALFIEHFRAYKKPLNLKTPKYFGEKIQWIKLYGNLEQFSHLADKHAVRSYVEEKLGPDYLNQLIGVYNCPEAIDFDALPNQFVLKGVHGSAQNFVCKDKSMIHVESLKQLIKRWLLEDFSKLKRENQYANIQPRVICERYLEDYSGGLVDYKVYCFKGKPEFIQAKREIGKNKFQTFFGLNWNRLFFTKGHRSSGNYDFIKPDCLYELLNCARILSEGLPFVRVDFYIVGGKVYFGELTFTPAGGSTAFYPLSKDLEYAERIDLSLYGRNINLPQVKQGGYYENLSHSYNKV